MTLLGEEELKKYQLLQFRLLFFGTCILMIYLSGMMLFSQNNGGCKMDVARSGSVLNVLHLNSLKVELRR